MKNAYLKTLYISNGVFVFASALLVPIFALYLEGFEVSVVEISMTSTFFLLSAGFFLLFIPGMMI